MGKRIILLQVGAVIIATAALLLVLNRYYSKPLVNIYASTKQEIIRMQIRRDQQSYICPQSQITIKVPDGKVCRVANVATSTYQEIFDTYPFYSEGKDQIYSDLTEGTIAD